MPYKLSSVSTPQRRFPVRVPIRMTEAERATIGKSACALNRSISRYLVEIATVTRLRSCHEEKTRLRFLCVLLGEAAEKVQSAQEGRKEIAEVRVALQEAARLLETIAHELKRGLGER